MITDTTKKYHARFFNGKTAIPVIGMALLFETTLTFQSETLSQTFSVESFHNLVPFPGGIRCIFVPDEMQESPILEILCDPKETNEIEYHWSVIKKGTNLIPSIILFFKSQNPIALIASSLTLLLLVGIFFFFMLQKVYIFFPTSIDTMLGERFNQSIESTFPICKSKAADDFFSLALKDIAPKDSKFKYTIQVIDLPNQNAISLAGGKIYFFSGLLEASDGPEEIIGVLAHEISHVEKRHHVRSLIKALGTALAINLLVGPGLSDFQTLETLTELGSTVAVLKFSRDFESEADRHALQLLTRANRSAQGLLTFLRRINNIEQGTVENNNTSKNLFDQSESSIGQNIMILLSTHPRTSDRVDAIQEWSKSLKKFKSKPLVTKDKWKLVRSSCKK